MRFRIPHFILALLLSPAAFAGVGDTGGDPSEPALSEMAEADPAEAGIERLSMLELGMGIGSALTPDYPGSNQSRVRAIPFPYGAYRGKILYSDKRGGARARLLTATTYEVSVSGGGGFPVSSSENDARRGMPDLDWMGQVGPRLQFRLIDFEKGGSLRVGFPVRAVVTASSLTNFVHRGWVYAPEMIADWPNVFGDDTSAYVLVNTVFADQKFRDYIYSVKPEHATSERPAYEAKGGYMLSDMTLGASYAFAGGRHKLVGALTTAYLGGAANESGPLMKSRWNVSGGLIWIYTFYFSEKKVTVDD